MHTSKCSIKQSHHTRSIQTGLNAMKIFLNVKRQKIKTHLGVCSSIECHQQLESQVDAREADFVHNLSIITAVEQNHSNGTKS